jgi:flagellar motor component MotA
MIGLFGVAFVLVTVFGGYLLAGGKMGIILKALPFEMIMICGAGIWVRFSKALSGRHRTTEISYACFLN